MSKLSVDVQVPLNDQAGHVAIKIDVPDLEHLADRDRKLVLDLLDRLAVFTHDRLRPVT